MIFIIKGMKYDTDKMEKVADVKKWYRVDNLFFARFIRRARSRKVL